MAENNADGNRRKKETKKEKQRRLSAGTMTSADGYVLPTAGRVRDFHPLERALAGRTNKKHRAPCRDAVF